MAGFWLHSVPILFVALCLFGVIAALFGPIKYGILPDHLQRAELPAGNALVEGATFLAILLGTIAGGLAAKAAAIRRSFGAMIMVLRAAVLGLEPAHPAHRRRARPTCAIDPNILRSTGDAAAATSGPTPRLWRGALIVSAGSGSSARWCCRCCRRW